jgi:hypothetical protein
MSRLSGPLLVWAVGLVLVAAPRSEAGPKGSLAASGRLPAAAEAARGEPAAVRARRRLEASRQKPADPPPTVTRTSEVYEVGAQYRGGMKKTFKELGRGVLSCATIAPDRFAVALEATVRHPRTDELLELSIDREYRLDGDRVRKVRENDQFNAAAQRHRKRFIDTVALAYLVKWHTPRTHAGPWPARTYRIDGHRFSFGYAPSGRWLEATLRGPDGIVGKLFLRSHDGGVRPIDKFRVHAREDLIVSFVKNSAAAVPPAAANAPGPGRQGIRPIRSTWYLDPPNPARSGARHAP